MTGRNGEEEEKLKEKVLLDNEREERSMGD